jgi:hypothetical protein
LSRAEIVLVTKRAVNQSNVPVPGGEMGRQSRQNAFVQRSNRVERAAAVSQY